MKVALPLDSAGEFAAHYGAATRFTVFDVDVLARGVLRQVTIVPEDSKPCAWPTLLRTAGAKLIIAGGIGAGALKRMHENGLWVLAGVEGKAPEEIVQRWLEERLVAGGNACHCAGSAHEHDDHAEHEHHGHGCSCRA